MTRVALVTCAEYSELDGAESRGMEALRALGVEVEAVVWDDDTVKWSTFDLAVVRSTWDYVAKREAFLEWMKEVPRLANPASVLRWNTDKRYLLDLISAGVPTVPTTVIEPGEDYELPETGEFVLKPAVGISAAGAGRFDATFDQQRGLAKAHVKELLDAGHAVLLQPYQRGIEVYGETSLIYLGGRFSHGVKRSAVLERSLGEVPEPRSSRIFGRDPIEAEFGIADQVFAAVESHVGSEAADLLYARVDVVPGADGLPVLMEVELIEPALFFGMDSDAASRFAEVVAERAGIRRRAVGRVPAPRSASSTPVTV